MWWWFKGRFVTTVAALLALATAACGFQPLHGTSDSGTRADAALAQIGVDPIADPTGQDLRNRLIDQLTPAGLAADPRYTLTVTLTEDRDRYGFEADREVTRERLRLVAEYRLVDRRDGGIVLSERARTDVAYDVVQSDYALVTARPAARRQAVDQLAGDMTRRLSLALKGQGSSD